MCFTICMYIPQRHYYSPFQFTRESDFLFLIVHIVCLYFWELFTIANKIIPSNWLFVSLWCVVQFFLYCHDKVNCSHTVDIELDWKIDNDLIQIKILPLLCMYHTLFESYLPIFYIFIVIILLDQCI